MAESDWRSAEAYWRVFQDWRAWTEEGILDVAIPMVYKRDHVAAEKTMFDQWNVWARSHQYNRGAMIGLGVYLNTIQGTVAQSDRARPGTLGVNFYSMANPAIDGTIAQFAAAFPDRPLLPSLPWKAVPAKGHLMGTIPGLDTATVVITGPTVRTGLADASDGRPPMSESDQTQRLPFPKRQPRP